MKAGTIVAGLSVVALWAMACGGSRSNVQGAAAASAQPVEATATSASAAPPASAAPSASAATSATASAASAASKPVERPFAATALEAQSMIQSQIDSQMKVLWKCVHDYRVKAGDPHKPVVADIGIDEEGKLIGVTALNSKHGGLDPALKDCMYSALRGAPFPRSHAGVITVRQTFTDAPISSQ
jgi:hypothetical protein